MKNGINIATNLRKTLYGYKYSFPSILLLKKFYFADIIILTICTQIFKIMHKNLYIHQNCFTFVP